MIESVIGNKHRQCLNINDRIHDWKSFHIGHVINQFHSFSREDNFLPNVISTKIWYTWPIYLSMTTKYDGAPSRDPFNEHRATTTCEPCLPMWGWG